MFKSNFAPSFEITLLSHHFAASLLIIWHVYVKEVAVEPTWMIVCYGQNFWLEPVIPAQS